MRGVGQAVLARGSTAFSSIDAVDFEAGELARQARDFVLIGVGLIGAVIFQVPFVLAQRRASRRRP